MTRSWNSLSQIFRVLVLILHYEIETIGSRVIGKESLESFAPFPERNGADDRESYGNGSMNETFAEERDADPCSLILSTETHVSEALLIKVSHSIFDISDGVLPGVTYQVSLNIPTDHEYFLEYWLGLEGSDEIRHFYPNPNNKKRRHQRDRRDYQWMELSSSFLGKQRDDSYEKTLDQLFFCSKNSIGGIQNLTTGNHLYTLDWFLKPIPYISSQSLNVVFRLRLRSIELRRSSSTLEQILSLKVRPGCHHKVSVGGSESTKLTLSSLWNFQSENVGLNCTILLEPPPSFGIEIRIVSLSIYGIPGFCKTRFLEFSSLSRNRAQLPLAEAIVLEPEVPLSLHQRYCGKIEDYSPEEKVLTFPTAELRSFRSSRSADGILLKVELPGHIKSKETFALELIPISPCDKVLLSNRSGTLQYEISNSFESESACSIVIHVPYGNTISLNLRLILPNLDINPEAQITTAIPDENQLLEKSSPTEREFDDDIEDRPDSEFDCILKSRKSDEKNGDHYFVFRMEESEVLESPNGNRIENHNRIFCLQRHEDMERRTEIQRHLKSTSNRIRLSFALDSNFPGFVLGYESESVEAIRRDCDDGWVQLEDSACIKLIETGRNWMSAEDECQDLGGHLATVRNDVLQRKLQQIITNSASFHPSRAYWIGANDRESEGNFQWTSGLPFIFTNWFPGWSGKGTRPINFQPNDDGLSRQDCVEIRQEFTPYTSNHVRAYGRNSGTRLPFSFLAKDENKLKIKARHGVRKSQEIFHWNDRNCLTLNPFLCERVNHQGVEFICNRTVQLGAGPPQDSVTVTSPAYPSSYPDDTVCITIVESIPGYRLIVNFDEFHLEESPSCKYDSLELIVDESVINPNISESSASNSFPSKSGRKFCGDWSRRLKLLRFTTKASKMTFKFESDFSHTFPGFKATIWMEKGETEQCAELHMEKFKSHCYSVFSEPVVNWEAAQNACTSLKGNLASVLSSEEWRFLTQLLVSSRGYRKNSAYWLGGYVNPSNQLVWTDRLPFKFSAFHPSNLQSISEWKCLSLYWHEGGKGTFAWRLSNCNQISGYICKKATKDDPKPQVNKAYTGIGGKLTSPNYPSNYSNNLDSRMNLSAPLGTVIVIQFLHMYIEPQDDCLYDYIQIKDRRALNFSRFCGAHSGKDLERYNFVSSSNEVDVLFHTDFSDTFSGYELIWRAVDVTECVSGKTILTGIGHGFHQTILHSPNFPYFNLPSLTCVYTIVAPVGQRIWLQFDIFEVGEDGDWEEEETETNVVRGRSKSCNNGDHVVIDLLVSETENYNPRAPGKDTSFQKLIFLCGNLTSSSHLSTFVSYGEKIRVHLSSRKGRWGRGFLGKFKAVSSFIQENLVVQTEPNSSFLLTSLNYPFEPPSKVNLTTSLTAPPNYVIALRIRGLVSARCHLTSTTYILIYDPYVGTNGTSWIICQPDTYPFIIEPGESHSAELMDDFSTNINKIFALSQHLQSSAPISFHSTFNRLEITQVYKGEGFTRKWNGEVITSLDENFRAKVLSGGDRILLLNACTPNPCLNEGRCVTEGNRHICRCPLPYTGPFCGLSVCDLSPCLFGDCVVEKTSYRCICHMGYAGENCDRRSKPCMSDGKEDKCGGNGKCVELSENTYKCVCHAFWEGPRCEERMQNIPFRPLSERMLREPFWLGIITVTVVLAIIGLVWCLKRHFPEKLEKLLNDETDRNRRISWVSARSPSSFRLGGGCSYHGVREAIPSTSQQATSPQASRSFLGRFGIRKPSLLSLSSATSVSAATTSPHNYENRTFSLDDLLRPSRSSMMRTPSPHRRRNFSIHSRRDPVEKQQILQQLVSSGQSVSLDGTEPKPATPKPTIAEIIQMSEKRLRLAAASSIQNDPPSPNSVSTEKGQKIAETSFNSMAIPSSLFGSPNASAASKAEKRVTFARLLDKLTAHDMSPSSSSCSDLSCPEDTTRTIILNPKPPKKDRKGRLRRSKAYSRGRHSETDQDGVEMSSSDTTPDPICPPRFPSRVCVSPTGVSLSANNSPNSKLGGKPIPKMASADSLLALFRRFSGSGSAPPSPQYSENEESSAVATPLSTPGSPRNSALSLNIRPPAFLITTPEISIDNSISPTNDGFGSQGTTWRAQPQNMNVSLDVPMRDYCLSPIHEVPTPLPTPSHSPAHSPMLHRLKESPDSNPYALGLPVIKLQTSSKVEDEDECKRNIEKRTPTPLCIPQIEITQESDGDTNVFKDSDGSVLGEEEDRSQWQYAVTACRDVEVIPDVLIHMPRDVSSPQNLSSDRNQFNFHNEDLSRNNEGVKPSSTSTKTRPPPLIFASEIINSDSNLFSSLQEENEQEGQASCSMIPTVKIQNPTPVGTPTMSPEQLQGKVAPVLPDITAFTVLVSPKQWEPHANAAHAPLPPPIITINQTSEAESDSDTPVRKLLRKPNLSFLSPFAGTSDRVPSESNLSTSGYSSMASPCPSRCPSVSPLYPDMDEYRSGTHHHSFRRSSLATPGSSRKSSLTLTPRRCSLNAASPLVSFASNAMGIDTTGRGIELNEGMEFVKAEADSALEVETETDVETKKGGEVDVREELLSLMTLLQLPRKSISKSYSLDMDVIEENLRSCGKISSNTSQRVKSQYIRKGDSLDSKLNTVNASGMSKVSSRLNSFIPVHESESQMTKDQCGSKALEEHNLSTISRRPLSPLSSRSDSMSELSIGAGMIGDFTSPITDSDGGYDYASSEVYSMAGTPSRDLQISYANSSYLSPSQLTKQRGRRKNRRQMTALKKTQAIPSGKVSNADLSIPEEKKKEIDTKTGIVNSYRLATSPTKNILGTVSIPKRRVRAQTNLDATSSSSESLNSLRSNRNRAISPQTKPNPSTAFSDNQMSRNEDVRQKIKQVDDCQKNSTELREQPITYHGTKHKQKSQKGKHGRNPSSSRSRLKAISLKIQFLRGLERRLVRKREALIFRDKSRRESQSESSSTGCSCCSTCSGSTSSTSCTLSLLTSTSTEYDGTKEDESSIDGYSRKRKTKSHKSKSNLFKGQASLSRASWLQSFHSKPFAKH